MNTGPSSNSYQYLYDLMHDKDFDLSKLHQLPTMDVLIMFGAVNTSKAQQDGINWVKQRVPGDSAQESLKSLLACDGYDSIDQIKQALLERLQAIQAMELPTEQVSDSVHVSRKKNNILSLVLIHVVQKLGDDEFSCQCIIAYIQCILEWMHHFVSVSGRSQSINPVHVSLSERVRLNIESPFQEAPKLNMSNESIEHLLLLIEQTKAILPEFDKAIPKTNSLFSSDFLDVAEVTLKEKFKRPKGDQVDPQVPEIQTEAMSWSVASASITGAVDHRHEQLNQIFQVLQNTVNQILHFSNQVNDQCEKLKIYADLAQKLNECESSIQALTNGKNRRKSKTIKQVRRIEKQKLQFRKDFEVSAREAFKNCLDVPYTTLATRNGIKELLATTIAVADTLDAMSHLNISAQVEFLLKTLSEIDMKNDAISNQINRAKLTSFILATSEPGATQVVDTEILTLLDKLNGPKSKNLPRSENSFSKGKEEDTSVEVVQGRASDEKVNSGLASTPDNGEDTSLEKVEDTSGRQRSEEGQERNNSKLHQSIEAIKQEKQDLEGQIGTLNESLAQSQLKIDSLNEKLQRQESSIASLEQEKVNLEARVKLLEEQVATLKGASALNIQVDGKTFDESGLRAILSDFKQTKKELEASRRKRARLSEKVKTLSEAHDVAQSSTTKELTSRIRELEEKERQLIKQNADLVKKISQANQAKSTRKEAKALFGQSLTAFSTLSNQVEQRIKAQASRIDQLVHKLAAMHLSIQSQQSNNELKKATIEKQMKAALEQSAQDQAALTVMTTQLSQAQAKNEKLERTLNSKNVLIGQLSSSSIEHQREQQRTIQTIKEQAEQLKALKHDNNRLMGQKVGLQISLEKQLSDAGRTIENQRRFHAWELEYAVPAHIASIQLPDDVQFVMETLIHLGAQAYVYGGYPRDVLKGLTPKDADIVTNLGESKLQLFKKIITEQLGGQLKKIDKVPGLYTLYRPGMMSIDIRVVPDFELSIFPTLVDMNLNTLLVTVLGRVLDPLNQIQALFDNDVHFQVSRDEVANDPVRILRALKLWAKFNAQPNELDQETMQVCIDRVQSIPLAVFVKHLHAAIKAQPRSFFEVLDKLDPNVSSLLFRACLDGLSSEALDSLRDKITSLALARPNKWDFYPEFFGLLMQETYSNGHPSFDNASSFLEYYLEPWIDDDYYQEFTSRVAQAMLGIDSQQGVETGHSQGGACSSFDVVTPLIFSEGTYSAPSSSSGRSDLAFLKPGR